LANKFGLDTAELKQYTLADNMRLTSVLPQEFKDGLIGSAEGKDITRLNKQIEFQKRSLIDLGKSKGVSEKSILKDLKSFEPQGSLLERPSLEAYLKSINAMHNTLKQTTGAPEKMSKEARLSIADKAFNALFQDFPNGEAYLEKHNLLEASRNNPLVNLEGNLHRDVVELMKTKFRGMILSGNTRKVNPEAMVRFGSLLSERSIEDIFGANKLQFAREVLGSMSTYKARKLLNENKTSLKKIFGGELGLKRIEKQIKNIALEKTFTSSTQAFSYNAETMFDSGDIEKMSSMMELIEEEKMMSSDLEQKEIVKRIDELRETYKNSGEVLDLNTEEKLIKQAMMDEFLSRSSGIDGLMIEDRAMALNMNKKL
jgi:hypothetical protein